MNTLDLRVKQVCNSSGVSVIAYGGYRSFALQVDKSRKHAGGNDLVLVVNALVERYEKLGLKREVLWSIAKNIFNVCPPQALNPANKTDRRSPGDD